MPALPRHNRITLGQLTEVLRGLTLRPQQRRIIAGVFSRYGDEGITRTEFEAGIYQLLNERRYQYTLKRSDIEAVRRSAFPTARPFGRPPSGEFRLLGGLPDGTAHSPGEPTPNKPRGRSGLTSGTRELPLERPRLRGIGR